MAVNWLALYSDTMLIVSSWHGAVIYLIKMLSSRKQNWCNIN